MNHLSEIYEAHGVRFEYPEYWEIEEARVGEELTITVSSPETSFWCLTLVFDRPAAANVIESALEGFRQEYDDLDIYSVESNMCQRETVSRDIEFVCLELVNSAFLRAFETDRFTALVYFQGTDHELEETREQLDAICSSLSCGDGDDLLP